jgi:23S rRNA pseudouridine2605 synthase
MEQTNPARRIGLARALSKLGYCSRSQAAALIREGRVRLNGVLRRDPETPAHLEKDKITIDGKAVGVRAKVYLMLNKPRGVVTTAADEKGRKTVYDFLGEGFSWVAQVGRLDKASEGLLLLTNDSEWSAQVLAPRTHLDKTYHVQVGAVVDAAFTSSLVNGVRAEDGEILRATKARIFRGGERNTWLEIILDEGRNRQIRRMLEHFDIDVLRLVRVAIGPLALGKLAKGAFRALTPAEKGALDRAMKDATSLEAPNSSA